MRDLTDSTRLGGRIGPKGESGEKGVSTTRDLMQQGGAHWMGSLEAYRGCNTRTRRHRPQGLAQAYEVRV